MLYFDSDMKETRYRNDILKKRKRPLRSLRYLNYRTTLRGEFLSNQIWCFQNSNVNILVNPDLRRRHMHIFLIQNYAAPATKKPFMNEGKCIVTGDNFKCICTDGFTGSTCESSLAEVRKFYQIHHLTGPDHTTHTTQMHRFRPHYAEQIWKSKYHRLF